MIKDISKVSAGNSEIVKILSGGGRTMDFSRGLFRPVCSFTIL